MKYVQFVNELLRKKISEAGKIVIFGQNVNAGSCLSGLTANFKVFKNSFVINTPNSENTLCGIGFGLMISGVPSIFFMKQQDFLLLGVDHLVNTYNIIRQDRPAASFTIVTILADSGYEGPQSGLNNFADFCSIARIDGFTITNKIDAEEIINSHLLSLGFRVIGVSQRLFKKEVLECSRVYSNNNASLFQYTHGEDATIVCFNFSFPYGLELYDRLKAANVNASLFSVNALTPIDWLRIIESVKKTKRIIIIDDGKSINAPWNNLLNSILEECTLEAKIIIKREPSDWHIRPNHDLLVIDFDGIAARLSNKAKKGVYERYC